MITSPKIKDRIYKDAYFAVFRNTPTGHVLQIVMFYYRENAQLCIDEIYHEKIYPYGEVLTYKELRSRLHKESIVKNAFNFYLP